MLTQEEVRNIMLLEQVSVKPRSVSTNSAVEQHKAEILQY